MSDAAVSAEEVARFGALAPRWWDVSGPMRPLHAMNALRVGWVATRVGRPGGLLDIGCGGGIAAEAFARKGFSVTGVDASAAAIEVARSHAAAAGLDIDYRVCLARDLLADARRYPVVTALEIIEHVPDQPAFLTSLAALLEPGGVVFVSTLNRTLRSLAVAKIGAEYVVRLLPVGTHRWGAFVRPEELAAMGRAAGLRLADVSGMVFGPVKGWTASRDNAVNYIAALIRD